MGLRGSKPIPALNNLDKHPVQPAVGDPASTGGFCDSVIL